MTDMTEMIGHALSVSMGLILTVIGVQTWIDGVAGAVKIAQ